MKKISSYIARYWYYYLFAIACMVTAIALDMMYPMITKRIVNEVFVGGNMEILPMLLFTIISGMRWDMSEC